MAKGFELSDSYNSYAFLSLLLENHLQATYPLGMLAVLGVLLQLDKTLFFLVYGHDGSPLRMMMLVGILTAVMKLSS